MFDRYLVVLKEFDGFTLLQEFHFDNESFWIQLHTLPLGGMNQRVGKKVGSVMGKRRWMYDNSGSAWGKFLRIQVLLDLTKPLIRGLNVRIGSKQLIWVSCKHERLPRFCFNCGVIHCMDKKIVLMKLLVINLHQDQVGSMGMASSNANVSWENSWIFSFLFFWCQNYIRT